MACDVTRGRLEPCRDTIGGIRNVYFIDYNDANKLIAFDSSDTEVIEFFADTGDTVDGYKYELTRSNSSYEGTIVASKENGTVFYQQTLNLTLHDMTKEDQAELENLSKSRLIILFEDYNSNIVAIGEEYGAYLSAGTSATGAAMGDMNGYTLTFLAEERSPARFVKFTTDIATTLSTARVAVTSGT
jgi:hypothetical protein